MINKVGLLEKIYVVKEAPMMTRFTLNTIRRSYDCIVMKPELVAILTLLQEGKYNLYVEGDFNKKKQLVVTNLTVRNPDNAAKQLGYKEHSTKSCTIRGKENC